MSSEVPEGWTAKPIAQLMRGGLFIDGDWIESKDQDQDGAVRLVQLADIGDGVFVDKSQRFMTNERAKELNCTFLKQNDVLVARMPNPLGRACLFPLEQAERYVTVVDIAILRPDPKGVDCNWLMYLLNEQTQRSAMLSHSSGTTRQRVSRGNLGSIEVTVPPLPEQKKIAAILTSVDAAIAATDALIAQTRRVKQGVLKQLLTRGIGHTRFKQTEIGEIPEGWEVKRLEQVAKVERGRFSVRPRNDPRYFGGDIPFVQTGDVTGSDGLLTSHTQTLNSNGLKVSKLFPSGSILITIAANIGDTAITTYDVCCPDSVVGITPHFGVNVVWLREYLQSKKSELDKASTQNAQKNINLQTLKPMLIATPPTEEQAIAGSRLQDINNAIKFHGQNINRLTSLKSALMSDLLTGRKRVSLP